MTVIQVPKQGYLPRDLVSVYTTYKKYTDVVVDWLLIAGSNDKAPKIIKKGHSCVPYIDELRFLADRIVRDAVFVPDTILTAFRLTIEARETMTYYYRNLTHCQDLVADDAHVIFTLLLRGIYHDLKRTKKPAGRRRHDSGLACHVECQNPFDCLHDLDPRDKNETHVTKSPSEITSERIKTQHKTLEERSEDNVEQLRRMQPEEDKLEEFMNICSYLIQLEDLSKLVVDLHKDVAANKYSLVVASLTTNIAYQCAVGLSQELQQHDIFDPAGLQERHARLMHSNHVSKDHLHVSTPSEDLSTIKSLSNIWNSVVKFRFHVNSDTTSAMPASFGCHACKHPFQDPVRCFGLATPPPDAESNLEVDCLDSMLHGLRNHIVRVHEAQPSIVFRTPLLRDLDGFLKAEEGDLSLALQLSFGLHLLLESYKAFLIITVERTLAMRLEDPGAKGEKVANPRIQSLKFAADLKTNLEIMMKEPCAPCECLKVNGAQVALHLKNFHFMLQDYVRTPRFDLLAQAPWISGQHMVDHLMLSLKYGLQGWHHGYFVGLVLHVYNALVHVDILSRTDIPVLEAMCVHFEDTVFMNTRDSPNAYSCYKRWTGGKVAFTSHRRTAGHTHAQPHVKKWNMCSVPDASHGGDHKQRSFKSSNMSLFSLLAEGCHFLDSRVLAWLDGQSPKNMRTHTHKEMSTVDNLVQHVQHVRDRLIIEIGTTSPARINTFHFYRLCLRALDKISNANHSAADQGILCRCIPERCLRTCERYRNELLLSRQGKVVLMEDRMAAESCRDALKEIFGGLAVEDVMWRVM